MSNETDGGIELEYGLDDTPPLPKSLLLAIQHVAVMIVPATAVAYIVAGAVGLNAADTAYIGQMVLLFSGLATVIQAYTVGPVGAKLPIVMGTSFTFVGAAVTIGIDYGLGAVFGGAVLLMVGMVAASGVRLIFPHVEMVRRNMTIMAVALGLGLGVATTPEALQGLPDAAVTFFGEPVILTALSALLLNTFVPGKSSPLFDVPGEPVPGTTDTVPNDD